MTRVDLEQLQQELDAAGVAVPNGLCTLENTLETVRTPDATGALVLLPPAADPVLAAHIAPPLTIEYAGSQTVDTLIVTTDDQPKEAFRFQTTPQYIYRGTFRMTAVDVETQTTRDTEARVVFRRTQTALIQVGSVAILASFAEPAAASWAIIPTVDGTDLVISVKGSAGRTVDWLALGEVGQYCPGGLEGLT